MFSTEQMPPNAIMSTICFAPFIRWFGIGPARAGGARGAVNGESRCRITDSAAEKDLLNLEALRCRQMRVPALSGMVERVHFLEISDLNFEIPLCGAQRFMA